MRIALQRTLLPVSLACAAMLAACGGGGGSASPGTSQKASANSDVSASNYQSFSGPLARAVLDLGSGTAVSDVFGGTAGAQSASLARNALAVKMAGRASIQSVRRQAVSQRTDSCGYAGTMTISFNDANNNQQADAGDSITVSTSNCKFTSTDETMNGSFSVTVQKLQIDSQGNPTALQMSGSFTNLSMGSDTMNGGFSFAMNVSSDGSETLQMGFSNLTTTHAGQTVTYNATMSASYAASGAGTFSINGTFGQGTEVYLLEQSQPFSIGATDTYPVAGSLRLEDAAGDALVIEAKAGNLVDFKFYPAGATAPSQQLLNQPWSNYGG
jgi:hypothetical protein